MHDIENMKSSHVGGHVKSKDIAETIEKLKSKEEEVKQIVKNKREEESEVDDSSSYSELDSSEDESEHEHGDSLDKLFDG